MKKSTIMAAVLLVGCAGRGKLDTPSGFPEVLIEDKNLEACQLACLEWIRYNRYSIEYNTQDTVQGSRIRPDAVNMAIWWGGHPSDYMDRMKFDLAVVENDDVKIYGARIFVNRNPWGQATEEAVSQMHLEQVQAILEQIAVRVVEGKEFKDLEIEQELKRPKKERNNPIRRGARRR